jgi:hypothetical protein
MSGSRRGRGPRLALAVAGVALITLFAPGVFDRLPERFGSYVMVAVALAAAMIWLYRRRR